MTLFGKQLSTANTKTGLGLKAGLSVLVSLTLFACASDSSVTPLNVTRMLFGYIEPPKAESVMTSLRKEYNRCMAIDDSRNCVQLAYDQVRVTQGLDPKAIPEGYVIVVQEEIENPKPSSEQSSDSQ
jgi:hypothetical protein